MAYRPSYSAIDPSIISSAITVGGALAQTGICAVANAKKKKKKKKSAAPSATDEGSAAPAPVAASTGMPSWALYAGIGVLVLVGGFMLLRKNDTVPK